MKLWDPSALEYDANAGVFRPSLKSWVAYSALVAIVVFPSDKLHLPYGCWV